MALRSVWLGVCNPSKGSVAIIGISNVIPATILPPVANIGKAREKQAASVVVACGNYINRRWVLDGRYDSEPGMPLSDDIK
jgi:hypothetical protein